MMTSSTPELRIGTSGWVYRHWKGDFYPEDLPQKRWFEHYARHFDTVEINNTFYRLPEPPAFDAWRDVAPPGFRYALKFSRFATHMKKLKDPREPLQRFLQRAERLRNFLGPILVQLPPRWSADPPRLEAFLKTAPRRHRWAIEFRDRSWLSEEVFDILRRHQAALCIHDMIEGEHPRQVTAPFTYLRYHGQRYGGTYSRQALQAEARWIRRHLRNGVEVWAYFNNDAHGYAVHNARDLREMCPPAGKLQRRSS